MPNPTPPQTDSPTPELLPCPFCGEKVTFIKSHVYGEGGRIIHSKNVTCIGESIEPSLYPDADAALIKQWNTRADKALHQQNTSLREQVEKFLSEPHQKECGCFLCKDGRAELISTRKHRDAALLANARLVEALKTCRISKLDFHYKKWIFWFDEKLVTTALSTNPDTNQNLVVVPKEEYDALKRQLNRRLYSIWRGMNRRCHNPNCKDFEHYSGRGITVCERWRGKDGFSNFSKDMGIPENGMTIERKDNDKGYSPDNCIWATRIAQSRNTTKITQVTIGGVTKCLREWESISGLSHGLIAFRIRSGWPESDWLKKPQKQKYLKK